MVKALKGRHKTARPPVPPFQGLCILSSFTQGVALGWLVAGRWPWPSRDRLREVPPPACAPHRWQTSSPANPTAADALRIRRISYPPPASSRICLGSSIANAMLCLSDPRLNCQPAGRLCHYSRSANGRAQRCSSRAASLPSFSSRVRFWGCSGCVPLTRVHGRFVPSGPG